MKGRQIVHHTLPDLVGDTGTVTVQARRHGMLVSRVSVVRVDSGKFTANAGLVHTKLFRDGAVRLLCCVERLKLVA